MDAKKEAKRCLQAHTMYEDTERRLHATKSKGRTMKSSEIDALAILAILAAPTMALAAAADRCDALPLASCRWSWLQPVGGWVGRRAVVVFAWWQEAVSRNGPFAMGHRTTDLSPLVPTYL